MIEAVKDDVEIELCAKQACIRLQALLAEVEMALYLGDKKYTEDQDSIKGFIDLVKSVLVDGNIEKKEQLASFLNDDLSHNMLMLQESQQEQLQELIYDIQLILSQKYPLNSLEKEGVHIYVSSRHALHLESLISHINKTNSYINPITHAAFNKRDTQLIRLAAASESLSIVSQKDTSSDSMQRLLSDHGIHLDHIKIQSRYNAESTRHCNLDRINIAVKRAFMDVYRDLDSTKQYASAIDAVTLEVAKTIANLDAGSMVDVERIQAYVESALMDLGYHAVARSYVLYRERKNSARKNRQQQLTRQLPKDREKEPSLKVTMPDGSAEEIARSKIMKLLSSLSKDVRNLDISSIASELMKTAYKGMDYVVLKDAMVMSCRCMIEIHPSYSGLAAQLLRKKLLDECYAYLSGMTLDLCDVPADYSAMLATTIEKGIENEIISPKMAGFDMAKLSSAINCDRDNYFTYLGLQTLYDRYFIHDNTVRYELPQIFFMRVAMGLALEEDDMNARAIEFYDLLSSFDYMSSTPTLFNSGTVKSQLSSCYLTTIPDDLQGIYGSIQDNAMLQKFAGGLGNDWTPVRGTGARIKGTNGVSSGIIPFMNVADATAIAVNQGGKRKGAVCGYLETWHIDIIDFVELRKNTGDERRRTHDMNTANWIPDLFMERVMKDESWTLFSPNEVPELHDTFGNAFRKHYESYEKKAEKGEIMHKKISAVKLWRKMLSMVFETGHPWMTFKDPCNLRSPQQHCGVVHSSNLCTEITLNTSKDEIAVCNLGSVNLARHLTADGLDRKKLKKTINTAIRMLDNVIDINYYAVEQARNSNMLHRPIGLGMMGFQDALYKLGIAYDSESAVDFSDESMELISYYAITASSELAKERGKYKSYDGSLWDKGILPIDSIDLVRKERGAQYIQQDQDARLDWGPVRASVAKYGMRNSNVLAIAPTATIANICGVTQSIEPTYQNLYVKSNLSGEFTIVNPSLVTDLQKLQLWDSKMVNELKLCDGSLQNIDRIPESIRRVYKTAFEIDISYIVRSAAKRAKWIDQAQSLNLYLAKASGKKLDSLYKNAWLSGLKTTYYLRSLGATDTEKSSVNHHALNAVAVSTAKACSIDDPDCEACQ